METAYRYCLMLRMIPREPRKIDTRTIQQKIGAEYGEDISLRSIQRDLNSLSAVFPLVTDNRKPAGWSWKSDAPGLDIPIMDPVTALSFVMIKEFLASAMPPAVVRNIESHFSQAQSILSETSRGWPDKVGLLSRSQPLNPPQIESEVFDTVYDGLLRGKRFSAEYRRRGENSLESYTVNPLGIVLLDSVIYLVCTLWDYNQLKDIKQLALHRIVSAEKTDEDGLIPQGFNLKTYIDSGAFSYVQSQETLCLSVLFDRSVALHLQETPLSQDQTITDIDTDTVRVRATVLDTAQLRWWLLGFGDKIEVEGPDFLREEFRAVSKKMAGKYGVRQ